MIEIARKVGSDDARIILVNVIEDNGPGYVAVELPQGPFCKCSQACRLKN